jgi:putative aminopeptidase FrvX
MCTLISRREFSIRNYSRGVQTTPWGRRSTRSVITTSQLHPSGDLPLAVEVGPTEPEYDTTCRGCRIIAVSDAQCVYDKAVADALMAIANDGLSPQAAVLGAFESDSSHSKASGLSPRPATAVPADVEHTRL